MFVALTGLQDAAVSALHNSDAMNVLMLLLLVLQGFPVHLPTMVAHLVFKLVINTRTLFLASHVYTNVQITSNCLLLQGFPVHLPTMVARMLAIAGHADHSHQQVVCAKPAHPLPICCWCHV
jgi:hypothetical protein